MLFLLSPIHTPVHMHTPKHPTRTHKCTHMHPNSGTHTQEHTNSVPLAEGEKGEEKRREKRNRSPGIVVRVGGSYLVKIIYYPHPAWSMRWIRDGGLPLSPPLSPSLPARCLLQFNIYLRERAAATALNPNWFRHMGLCAQAADERGRAGWNAEGEVRKNEKKREERKRVGPKGKTTM